VEQADPKTIYPVWCPECGWFGMSDDVSRGKCPWCGQNVKWEEEDDGIIED